MRFRLLPEITKDIPSKERILELVRWGLYTLCFVGILFHLTEIYRVFYQENKEKQLGIAMVFFVLLIFVMQRVKLFNIPSLIVTVVYAVVSFYGTRMFLYAPAVFPSRLLLNIGNGLAILIITDMAVTGRVRRLKKSNLWLIGLLCLLVVLMQGIHANNEEPRVFLYFLLLCLVPVKEKEWGLVLDGLLTAGFKVSVLAALLSHIMNPWTDIIDIWAGYLGHQAGAGKFCALLTALSFVSIIRSKEKWGRFGIAYLISVIWFAMTIVYALLIGKTNYFFGLLFLLLFAFVFGLKKTKSPWLLLKGCLVLSLLFLSGYFLMDSIGIIASSQYDSAALWDKINRTPLRLFPGFAGRLVGRITAFSTDSRVADYSGNPVLALLNRLSSGRIAIAWEILKTCSFTYSTAAFGGYSTPHTGYLEAIYKYGFLGGGLNLLFFAGGFITAIARYVKEKRFEYFATIAIVAMMFGIWIGEQDTAVFPLTFVALFSLLPCIVFRGKEEGNGKG